MLFFKSRASPTALSILSTRRGTRQRASNVKHAVSELPSVSSALQPALIALPRNFRKREPTHAAAPDFSYSSSVPFCLDCVCASPAPSGEAKSPDPGASCERGGDGLLDHGSIIVC